MRNTLIFTLIATVFVLPQFVYAGSIDGSSPCLCAITRVIECDSQGECAEIQPEAVNIPTFIKIDFKDKTLGSLNSNGSKTTAIKNFEQADEHLVLQGAENKRAWSMMVTGETGKMSASVSGEGYGFLLFGSCTPLK